MMRLPEAQEKLFWDEMAVFEKEEKMPYVTSVEKIGIEKGIQQGMQQGIQRGMRKGESFMFAKMIAKKFGEQPDRVLQIIAPLTADQLEEMTDLFFQWDSFDALRDWVRMRTAGKAGE